MKNIVILVLFLLCSSSGTALAQTGKDAELLEKLKDKDAKVRKDAALSLHGTQGSALIMPLLDIAQKETDHEVRETLMARVKEIMERTPDQQALGSLAGLLKEDGNKWVRCYAASALGNSRNPQALFPLVFALKNDQDFQVRGSAAQALGKVAVPEAIEPLLEALKDKASTVSGNATLALFWIAETIPENLKNEKAMQSLADALNLQDPLDVGNNNICSIFAKLKARQSIKPLLSILQKGIDPHLRSNIEEILASMKDEKDPALLAFLAAREKKQKDVDYAEVETKLTKLHKAVEDNNAEKVSDLLSRGADINARAFNGATPLMLAVAQQNQGLVKLLISKGADISSKDELGRTVLYYAVENDDKAMIQLLFEHEIDMNCVDMQGLTPRGYAKYLGLDALADFLKGKGAQEGETVSARTVEDLEPKSKEEAARRGLAYFAVLDTYAGCIYGKNLKAGDYAVYSPYGNDESFGDAGKIEVRVTKKEGDIIDIIEQHKYECVNVTVDVKRMKMVRYFNPGTKESFDFSALAVSDIPQLREEFKAYMKAESMNFGSNYVYKKSSILKEIQVPAGTFRCIVIEPDIPSKIAAGMSQESLESWKVNGALYLNSGVPKLLPQEILSQLTTADSLDVFGDFEGGLVKYKDYELIEFSKQ